MDIYNKNKSNSLRSRYNQDYNKDELNILSPNSMSLHEKAPSGVAIPPPLTSMASPTLNDYDVKNKLDRSKHLKTTKLLSKSSKDDIKLYLDIEKNENNLTSFLSSNHILSRSPITTSPIHEEYKWEVEPPLKRSHSVLEVIVSNIEEGKIKDIIDPSTGYSHIDNENLKYSNLRLLGIHIGQYSPLIQYIICALGVFFFLLLYGYLQELVVVEIFDKNFSIYISFLQFSGFATFSLIQRILYQKNKEKSHNNFDEYQLRKIDSIKYDHSMENTKNNQIIIKNKILYLLNKINIFQKIFHKLPRSDIPIKYYIILAFLQVTMQTTSYLSLMFLNYPAKVLFKSSRPVLTIVVSTVFLKKHYSKTEYFAVILMVLGLILFVKADIDTSPSFHLYGVIFIIISIICDAIILNFQDYVLSKYHSCHQEMITFTYSIAAFIMLIIALGTGQFLNGFLHLSKDGITSFIPIIALIAVGFLGVSCVVCLTRRFGALISSITTTTRKAFTLALSFVFFPKPLLFQHILGATLFCIALFLKSLKSAKKHISRSKSETNLNSYLKTDKKIEI